MYFSRLRLWVLDFGCQVLDFGFWDLDFGFWVLGGGRWRAWSPGSLSVWSLASGRSEGWLRPCRPLQNPQFKTLAIEFAGNQN